MTAAERIPDGGPAEDVLARAVRGDITAFGELLARHESRVFSVALRFTGRHADAEELTQDVFLKLHGSLPQINDALHLKRWLLRTVTHRCLDRLRDESRRPLLVPIEIMPAEAEPRESEQDPDPLTNRRIRQLLLELAPDARAVVLLRFQEELDPSEIATVLGLSVNTVKSHLRRSVEWLRGHFPGEGHGF